MKRVWQTALIIALALVAAALSYFAQFRWFKDGWPIVHDGAGKRIVSIAPVGSVLISEVMSSNRTSHAGVNGMYPDWVELYNSGSEPCDITNWTLTDDADSVQKFTFPQRVLQPGELVIVYLTDVLSNAPDAPYQAPFKLSSKGDALLLYDASGSIMEALVIPALAGDAAYARIGSDGDFIITKLATPGLINTNDSYREMSRTDERSDVRLEITRLMPDNKTYLKDANGLYSDWVEIHNPTSLSVSLKGLSMSDDMYERGKWAFPADASIEPGGYLTIFCTGESSDSSASFKLSAQGESVVLCDSYGRIIDSVDFPASLPDQIWTRQPDGSLR